MKLRPYEHRAVGEIVAALEHSHVLGVGPTGCGKTVVGVAVAQHVSRHRCLWVAHRIELLRQARDELIAAGVRPEDVGILSGAERQNAGAKFLVSSIGMLGEADLDGFDLIVVDEAHRSAANSYRALAARSKAKRLGLTATPERLDGKPLRGAFDHMVTIAEHTELVADGWLVRPHCYGLSQEEGQSLTRGVRARAGDYAVDEIAAVMRSGRLIGNVVTECARLAPGAKTIVFAVNRQHGKDLAERFHESGRVTAYLDGETTNFDRDAIVRELRAGDLEVVVNVDVLSEGFDCPPVKCIALARPTKSLVRFIQQVGRASRPHLGQSPIVLDHAGNIWRHGLPDAVRSWSLSGRPKEAVGEAPVKQCDSCERFIPAGTQTCEFCGEVQARTERELAEEARCLERIKETEAMLAERLPIVKEIARRRGASDEWVSKVMGAFRA